MELAHQLHSTDFTSTNILMQLPTGHPPPGLPGTGNSGLNYPLIRFAEVLLVNAEAQNESGGPNARHTTL